MVLLEQELLYTVWKGCSREARSFSSSIIDSVLNEVDDTEYVQTLAPLLRQKRKTVKARSEYEATMKLIKYAMGRGFTIDIIRQCIAVDHEDEFLD